MARKMSGAEGAEKWGRNLGGAVADIRAGVDAVTENPCELAAAKAVEWQAAVTAPRARERFEGGLRRVSLAEWKRKTIDVGTGRIASGAAAAVPKMKAFLDEFLPHVYGVAETVRRLPKLTLEDGIARATAQIRGNAEFHRS